MGEDPFGQILDATLNGKDKDGAAFQVKRLGAAGAVNADALKACQIVFVASDSTGAMADLRAKLAGAPVLVLGETDDAVERGAMAALAIVGGKPNIQVHITRVREHKLDMAAKLLQAADVRN